MDWNKMEGTWRQWRGAALEQWGALTDDKIDQIAGRQEQLIGTLQALYGWDFEEALAQVTSFREHLHHSRTLTEDKVQPRA